MELQDIVNEREMQKIVTSFTEAICAQVILCAQGDMTKDELIHSMTGALGATVAMHAQTYFSDEKEKDSAKNKMEAINSVSNVGIFLEAVMIGISRKMGIDISIQDVEEVMKKRLKISKQANMSNKEDLSEMIKKYKKVGTELLGNKDEFEAIVDEILESRSGNARETEI